MRMNRVLSIDELTAEIGTVTSGPDARAVVNRASRVAGVPHDRPLEALELLQVCEALAVEGGLIQEIAELIASRTLRP